MKKMKCAIPIKCACGCGEIIMGLDCRGNRRRYKEEHCHRKPWTPEQRAKMVGIKLEIRKRKMVEFFSTATAASPTQV